MAQDLQSNLANALNDIGVKNAAAFDGIGTAISTIADIAGAVGGIGGIVSLAASFMGQGDQTQQELQNILTTIQNDFAQLNQTLKAEDLIQKLTDIGNQLAPAKGVLDSLQSLVNQLPLSPYEVTQQMEICANAINALAPDANWLTPYNDEIYWNDWQFVWPPNPPWLFDGVNKLPGYGQQNPAVNPDGTAFNHTYILPAYLEAVFIFLSVGGCIDPNFLQNWSASVLQPASALLKQRHDTILAGIVKLSPGVWNGQILAPWLAISSVSGQPWLPFQHTGVTPLLNTASFPEVNVIGTNIEYGAVEVFSGANSVALHQLEPPLSSDSTDPAPYGKFQMRLARRFKLVYVQSGLLTAWNSINHLNAICGTPQLSGASPGVWSFQRDILPVTDLPPQDGNVSLLAVARFIRYTVPVDTPSDTLFTSLQTLLSV
jgi:hypothetical protein